MDRVRVMRYVLIMFIYRKNKTKLKSKTVIKYQGNQSEYIFDNKKNNTERNVERCYFFTDLKKTNFFLFYLYFI